MDEVGTVAARWLRALVVAVLLAGVAPAAGVAVGVAGAGPAGAAAPAASGSIGAGYGFTCGLTSAGGVRCFGRGSSGRLGRGSSVESTVPVDVTGLTSGVASVSVGAAHACAVTVAGAALCWGDNTSGQLGIGAGGSSNVPVGVTGLSFGVAAIAAGGSSYSDTSQTCALTTGGGVKCWGGNAFGQLGDASTDPSNAPVDVTGLSSGVKAIAAGGTTSCALTTSGGVKCWGRNVGNGTGVASSTPVDVTGLTSGVTSIAAGGQQVCAVTTGGGVKCWGGGGNGQLGDGLTNSSAASPVQVLGLTSGVVSVAGGGFHTCAVLFGGSVRCWGANLSGQGGTGVEGGNLTTPATVVDVAGARSVAAGDDHSCAVLAGGGMRCWGDDFWGQLGNGSRVGSQTPVTAGGLTSGVAAVSAGRESTCVRTTAGAARCWGDSSFGRLGTGADHPTTVPADVTGLGSGVAQVAAADAGYSACAVTSAGALECWGKNSDGELGNGSPSNGASSPTPVSVTGLGSGVAAVALGTSHACALTTGGGVKCWGRNQYGEVGDGTKTKATVPVDVQGLTSGVTAIALGGSSSCAITTGQTVKCWGRNDRGQLGDGTTTDSSVPVAVAGLTGVTGLADGGSHVCALTSTGSVSCWGYNSDGQVGNGSTSTAGVLAPTAVVGLASGVASVTASNLHSCAAKTTGALVCWGSNSYGELGDGTFTRALTPGPVSGLAAGVAAADAGSFHTCALTTGGAVRCWGYNSRGQLGTDPGWHPVTVAGGTVWWTSAAPLGITAEVSPAAGAGGWRHTTVTVSFTCTGGTAPLACPAPKQLGEGAQQSVTGTVTDATQATASVTVDGIDVDLTAPTLSGAPIPAPDAQGWHAGPLTVHWTCGDALSGVAPGTCPGDEAVSASGTTTRTASIEDVAGNPSGTATVTVRIDGRPAAFASWEDLVARLHADLLGRPATSAEVAAWTAKLQAGTATPGSLVATLRSSADHTGNVDPVTRLYRAYFLRIPDRAGLTYWIGKKRTGTSLGTISGGFAGSKEFTTRYGALGDAAFVALVYQNVLGRPGDPAGTAYWKGQLDAGRKTRGQVMAGFSESPEYRAKQASEVTSSVLPILLLHRTPTSDAFAASVAALDAGTATVRSTAATILNSGAYPAA